MSRTPDIVVIGGGVFGASISYFLAERQVGSVMVLEREHLASGATGASSAIVRVHYTNPWESQLAQASLEVFRNWADRVGGSCGYRKTGFLRIVGPWDLDRMRQNVAALRALGANIVFVAADDLRDLQPSLSGTGVAGAAYEPDGGFADGTDTVNTFMDRGADRGVIVHEGVTVTRLCVREDRVSGVETTRGVISTRCVVVAAGAWSIDLLRSIELVLPLRTKLIRAGLLEHAPGHRADHMTVIDDSVGTYFKPERSTRTELGLRYQWDVVPAHGAAPVPLPYIADGASRIVTRVPELAYAGVVRGWAAPDAFSMDGVPLLGAVPSIQGLYIAVGASGSGFKIAPAVGMSIADVIARGRWPIVDLTPLRPTRFDEGASIRSPTAYRRPGWRDAPLD